MLLTSLTPEEDELHDLLEGKRLRISAAFANSSIYLWSVIGMHFSLTLGDTVWTRVSVPKL